MTTVRRRITALLMAMSLSMLGIIATATPAHAACGDTASSWVPVIGSSWNLEIYILATSQDYTGQAVMTYSGQIAATVIDDTLEVFTGNWDFQGGTSFAWSATELGDNTNRLTFVADANDCGALGGVHAAYGIVIHQTQGHIANLFMGRIL